MSRDEIIAMGREAARRHRQERGLTAHVTDADMLRQLAVMLQPVMVNKTKANKQ